MTNLGFNLTSVRRFSKAVLCPAVLVFSAATAFAGTVTITSPKANSSNAGSVSISASANETVAFHLELWDNGTKLGDVVNSSVNSAYNLSPGVHTTTVLAVTPYGRVLNTNTVIYKVEKAAPPVSAAVTIQSPETNSSSVNAVRITARGNGGVAGHLEVWDNGFKLGNVFATSIDDVYVLPSGTHVMTVQAISASGSVLDRNSVNFTVAENCTTSSSVQCDLDQVKANNAQDQCNPAEEVMWVANSCGGGIQGDGGSYPINTGVEVVKESGPLPSLGSLSLSGHSLHLSELQGNGGYSNVLFRGLSPTATSTGSIDSHWVMDEYVHLPDASAHQAFEMDAQASIRGIWTKFYTECAFNIKSGTGYWAVFDSSTGGWIFLNGQVQNGQVPPVVPCNRSQFAQPWSGSGDPSFTGWHHISWSFLRDTDGTVTFQSLTFDGTTTEVGFKPNSATGGSVSDNGKFSALIQLDGVLNNDRKHDLVDAYVSQISLTHTP